MYIAIFIKVLFYPSGWVLYSILYWYTNNHSLFVNIDLKIFALLFYIASS